MAGKTSRVDLLTLEEVQDFLRPIGAEVHDHVEDRDGHRVSVTYLGMTCRGYSNRSIARAVFDACCNFDDERLQRVSPRRP